MFIHVKSIMWELVIIKKTSRLVPKIVSTHSKETNKKYWCLKTNMAPYKKKGVIKINHAIDT